MNPAHKPFQRPKLGRHATRAVRVFQALNLPDDQVLDAAAGLSPYREYFEGRVVGIDLRISSMIDFIGLVECLPFKDLSFNGITCFQVLHFLENPSQAFEEFYRVLKPGGWLAVSVSRGRVARRAGAPGGYSVCDDSPSEWDDRLKSIGCHIDG